MSPEDDDVRIIGTGNTLELTFVTHWNRCTLDRPAVCGATLGPGTGAHWSGRAHMYLFYVSITERCRTCEGIAVRELDELTRDADEARIRAQRAHDAVPCAKCGHPRGEHPYRHVFVEPKAGPT